jgi:hypothetical protein
MSEVIYRTAYTEGYQQAIKDVTVYKIPKITAKKFSIDELKKWQTFQDEYYVDFCIPPNARNFIPTQKNKINNLKYVYVIRGSRVNPTKSNYKIGITNNIKGRIENLQTSSPDKLELLFKYRTTEAVKLEKSLHNYFKYYRIRENGEWFQFEDTIISEWLRTEFQNFVDQL